MAVSGYAKSSISHSKKTSHQKGSGKQTKNNAASLRWSPDAKLLPLLQPETKFGAFSMRLPEGFIVGRPETLSNKGETASYAIKGTTRPDGTFPLIFVIIGVAASGYNTGSVQTLLDGNGGLTGRANLVKSSIQDGNANGLDLSREYFKFTDAPTDMYPKYQGDSKHSLTFHGFHYVTTDGQTDAIVVALDAEPYNATSLALAESAALTLHK